jgi:hypothetical protein
MNWDNKQEVLIKVSLNGIDLADVSDRLKNDKQVVMAAIKQNGTAFIYASADLKSDREIIEAAINGGLSVYFLNNEMKNKRDIVLMAVKKNGLSLAYTSEELQNDKELLLWLEKNNQKALEESPQWYEKRMAVLAKYKEQEIMENKLNKRVLSKEKLKKF